MGIYASPDDVAARWSGYNSTVHGDQALTDIGDAEALILDRVPTLPLRVSNGVVSERTVTKVICDMVIRHLKNPEGYRSEADGDYNYVYAPGAYTPGDVGMTVADLARLNGPRRGCTAGPNDDDALSHPVRGARSED